MRMWRTMFSISTMASSTRMPTTSASESAVDKYCRALGRTGFLLLVQPVVSGRPGSRNVWALVRDTGPAAPIRREDGTGVFDPTTGVAWGTEGLPLAKKNDHDAVARGLLAKFQDQEAARDLSDTYQACTQGEADE